MDIKFEEVEEGICDFGNGAIEFWWEKDVSDRSREMCRLRRDTYLLQHHNSAPKAYPSHYRLGTEYTPTRSSHSRYVPPFLCTQDH